jgi:hypothetical protein
MKKSEIKYYIIAILSAYCLACTHKPRPTSDNSLPTPPNMELFRNIEMEEYCVWLPTPLYEVENPQKGHHVFTLKSESNPFDYIDLQYFMIEENAYQTLPLLYEADKKNIEEGGLGIDTAYIDVPRSFYYLKGYLPNLPDKKWHRMVWITDKKLVLEIGATPQTEKDWEQRIPFILSKGMNCP